MRSLDLTAPERVLPLVTAACIVAIASVSLPLLTADSLQHAWAGATRATARFGLLLLLAAYIASSLWALWPSSFTRGLLLRRRAIGLAFASVMALHVLCIFALAAVTSEGHVVHVVDSGGAAYVLIALMALTSNDRSRRLLGVWWGRFHTFAINAILLKFATLVLPRALDGAFISLILCILMVAALSLRIAGLVAPWARRSGSN